MQIYKQYTIVTLIIVNVLVIQHPIQFNGHLRNATYVKHCIVVIDIERDTGAQQTYGFNSQSWLFNFILRLSKTIKSRYKHHASRYMLLYVLHKPVWIHRYKLKRFMNLILFLNTEFLFIIVFSIFSTHAFMRVYTGLYLDIFSVYVSMSKEPLSTINISEETRERLHKNKKKVIFQLTKKYRKIFQEF